MAKALVLALLLVGCQPVGDPVKVSTHCGLAIIEYHGQNWKFQGVTDRPPGWDDPFDTIYIQSVEGNRAEAIGPDGRLWSLVATDQTPAMNCL